MLEALIGWVSDQVLAALEQVADLLGGFLFVVPNPAGFPQVQKLWATNLSIVNTGYLLAVIAAGIVAMTYQSVQIRYSVKELLPRLVFATVAANFSLQWTTLILQTGNALNQAISSQPLTDTGTLQVIRRQVIAALVDPEVALLSLIAAVAVTGLLLMLIVQWMTRLAVLLVCVIVAPLALACYCLPRLDAAAGLWWRTLLGTLGVQLLQALLLHAGLSVFLDPGGQLPTLLPFHGNAEMVNLLVLLVLLWTCVKIPALMRRWVLRTSSGGGRAVAVLLIQQVTRTLARVPTPRTSPAPARGTTQVAGRRP
jgi:hypothetical protein